MEFQSFIGKQYIFQPVTIRDSKLLHIRRNLLNILRNLFQNASFDCLRRHEAHSPPGALLASPQASPAESMSSRRPDPEIPQALVRRGKAASPLWISGRSGRGCSIFSHCIRHFRFSVFLRFERHFRFSEALPQNSYGLNTFYCLIF